MNMKKLEIVLKTIFFLDKDNRKKNVYIYIVEIRKNNYNQKFFTNN